MKSFIWLLIAYIYPMPLIRDYWYRGSGSLKATWLLTLTWPLGLIAYWFLLISGIPLENIIGEKRLKSIIGEDSSDA